MKIHMVKKGDSLYEIANKYNVELDKLIELNPQIADPNVIEVGMKVKIPNAPKPAAPPSDYLYKHVVVQGDSLWKLGKAWNIPLQNMIEANPQLKNPNVLMTGEVIYIPKLKSQSKPDSHQPGQHQGIPKADTSMITPAVPLPAAEAAEPPVTTGSGELPSQMPVTEQPQIQMQQPVYEMQPPEIQMQQPVYEMQPPEIQMQQPVYEMQQPEFQMQPMYEMPPVMEMPKEPHMDLFQQFQVPATEVMSFEFETWTAPQLPQIPEMPTAECAPFETYAAAMPAHDYPVYPQQPFYKDCGCGGPAYPAYEHGIPYPYAPNMEYPAMEQPVYTQPVHHYPHAPYSHMMPGMEQPCFPVPFDGMAMTAAYPGAGGPGYPMHAYPPFPGFAAPYTQAKKECNCGCHDRENDQEQRVQLAQQPVEPKATISQKTEKAKVKNTKNSGSKANRAEAALRKLAQRNRRKRASSNGRERRSPWINV